MNLENNLETLEGFLLLKSGRIYDPFLSINKVSDILIKDGFITKISKNIVAKSNYKVISCKNEIVTNGFIDMHVHFREPGFEFKETILTGSLSAFQGGFTRVCTMPNTNPVIDNPELVKYIINKSISLPIYIHPIGAITKGQKGIELAEIGSMVNAGAIGISDDGVPIKNSQILRIALEYSKKYNIPVINHAEDSFLVNDGQINEGSTSLRLGLTGNPNISESTMIYRDLSIANYISGKIHVPHVSCAESIELIKMFKEKGLNVSAEVTPHHLSLTDSIISAYNNNAKVAPPIRSEKDKKALINAVKKGIINCIATDHAPHSIEDKEKDFQNSPCGMIGLESAFGLVNKTLNQEKMSIYSILDLFTINPSKIINIKPNLIEKGSLAELNIINPNYKWVFDLANIKSKSINSPIIGMELLGKVLVTINKGFISNYRS